MVFNEKPPELIKEQRAAKGIFIFSSNERFHLLLE